MERSGLYRYGLGVARFPLTEVKPSTFEIMTWSNACGFLFLGLAMLWLPAVAPGLVETGPHALVSSTRELWLLFMGSLNTSLGAGVMGWHAMKHSWRVPAWLARPVPQAQPLALPHATRAGVA